MYVLEASLSCRQPKRKSRFEIRRGAKRQEYAGCFLAADIFLRSSYSSQSTRLSNEKVHNLPPYMQVSAATPTRGRQNKFPHLQQGQHKSWLNYKAGRATRRNNKNE